MDKFQKQQRAPPQLEIQLHEKQQSRNDKRAYRDDIISPSHIEFNDILPTKAEKFEMKDEPEAEENTSYDNSNHIYADERQKMSFDNALARPLLHYESSQQSFNHAIPRLGSIEDPGQMQKHALELQSLRGDQIQSQKQLQINFKNQLELNGPPNDQAHPSQHRLNRANQRVQGHRGSQILQPNVRINKAYVSSKEDLSGEHFNTHLSGLRVNSLSGITAPGVNSISFGAGVQGKSGGLAQINIDQMDERSELNSQSQNKIFMSAGNISASINDVMRSHEINLGQNSQLSLVKELDQFGSMQNLQQNLNSHMNSQHYLSQSKLPLQNINNNSKFQHLSQYDIGDSNSSPQHKFSNDIMMSSKIQDEEGMSSNYDMKNYRDQQQQLQVQMLAQSSSDLLFQTQEDGIGLSNSNPDLIEAKEFVDNNNNFRPQQHHDSNGSSLDRGLASDLKQNEQNVLDDLELFIHEKADLALNQDTFEEKLRLVTSPPVVQSSQNANTQAFNFITTAMNEDEEATRFIDQEMIHIDSTLSNFHANNQINVTPLDYEMDPNEQKTPEKEAAHTPELQPDSFSKILPRERAPPVIPPKLDIADAGKVLDKAEMKKLDKNEKTSGEKEETDSFHKLYNKEIKVNQDEIPILLSELTDIAHNFIKKEQYEKAYVLLQKNESILEVLNLQHSRRDRFFAFITYHNMALCFQKLGMLEECKTYMGETIKLIEGRSFFRDKTISHRMLQLQIQCKLRLQLCAVQSQTQNHKKALSNAMESAKAAHQIFRDMYDLCVFYSNKIKFRDDFANLSILASEELNTKSKTVEVERKRNEKTFIRENSPVKDIPFNIFEESISMIERTALKLLPILKELGNRLAGTGGKKGFLAFHANLASFDYEQSSEIIEKNASVSETYSKTQNASKTQNVSKQKNCGEKESSDPEQSSNTGQPGPDMRTILGFLNQNEWISNMNIGNIMQISAYKMKDLLQSSRNEDQMSRESFLEKLSLLIVSYFCVSTEMRFLMQSKQGSANFSPVASKQGTNEQEYWHIRALDIACAFLPSECPLLNHIILSYQKHHDPTLQPIEEDKEQDDQLSIIKPINGIENCKFQPIVRHLSGVKVDISPMNLSPLSKCFDQRLQPPTKPELINVDCQVEIPDEKTPKAKQTDMATMTEQVKDSPQIAYQLQHSNSSKYQENMIQSILKDQRIQDKSIFIQKLVSKVGNFMDLKVQIDDQKFQRKSGLSDQQRSQSNLSTVDQNRTNSGPNLDSIYGTGMKKNNLSTSFSSSQYNQPVQKPKQAPSKSKSNSLKLMNQNQRKLPQSLSKNGQKTLENMIPSMTKFDSVQSFNSNTIKIADQSQYSQLQNDYNQHYNASFTTTEDANVPNNIASMADPLMLMTQSQESVNMSFQQNHYYPSTSKSQQSGSRQRLPKNSSTRSFNQKKKSNSGTRLKIQNSGQISIVEPFNQRSLLNAQSQKIDIINQKVTPIQILKGTGKKKQSNIVKQQYRQTYDHQNKKNPMVIANSPPKVIHQDGEDLGTNSKFQNISIKNLMKESKSLANSQSPLRSKKVSVSMQPTQNRGARKQLEIPVLDTQNHLTLLQNSLNTRPSSLISTCTGTGAKNKLKALSQGRKSVQTVTNIQSQKQRLAGQRPQNTLNMKNKFGSENTSDFDIGSTVINQRQSVGSQSQSRYKTKKRVKRPEQSVDPNKVLNQLSQLLNEHDETMQQKNFLRKQQKSQNPGTRKQTKQSNSRSKSSKKKRSTSVTNQQKWQKKPQKNVKLKSVARPKTCNFVMEGVTTQKKKNVMSKQRHQAMPQNSLGAFAQEVDRMNSSLIVGINQKLGSSKPQRKQKSSEMKKQLTKKGKKVPIDQRVDEQLMQIQNLQRQFLDNQKYMMSNNMTKNNTINLANQKMTHYQEKQDVLGGSLDFERMQTQQIQKPLRERNKGGLQKRASMKVKSPEMENMICPEAELGLTKMQTLNTDEQNISQTVTIHEINKDRLQQNKNTNYNQIYLDQRNQSKNKQFLKSKQSSKASLSNNISLKVIKRLDSMPATISGTQIGGGQQISMFDSEIDKNSSSYQQSISLQNQDSRPMLPQHMNSDIELLELQKKENLQKNEGNMIQPPAKQKRESKKSRQRQDEKQNRSKNNIQYSETIDLRYKTGL